jgi:hypothetical protein
MNLLMSARQEKRVRNRALRRRLGDLLHRSWLGPSVQIPWGCLFTLVIIAASPLLADYETLDLATQNTFVGLAGSPPQIHYNYFTIDLSGISQQVNSANLRLARGQIGTSFAPQPVVFPPLIFDLTLYGTASNVGNGTGVSRPVPRDVYGTFDILNPIIPDPIDPLHFIDLQLNSNAISDINSSRGGQLSFFGDLSIPNASTGVQEWFAFDGAVGAGGKGPIAQVTLSTSIPEPSTILLLVTVIAGLWLIQRHVE